MPTRHYSNTARTAHLAVACAATDTTLSLTAALEGWPAAFPFVASLDRGVVNKTAEAVLVTAASGTSLTVVRGYDGTGAVAHDANAPLQHDHIAIDYAETQSRLDALEAPTRINYTSAFLFGGP